MFEYPGPGIQLFQLSDPPFLPGRSDKRISTVLNVFLNSQVSLLSWWERRAAETLFGEIPASSFEESLRHFLAAEELRPSGWKENRLFIAKCHIQLDDPSSAATWLDKAASASVTTPDVRWSFFLCILLFCVFSSIQYIPQD